MSLLFVALEFPDQGTELVVAPALARRFEHALKELVPLR